MTTSPHRWTGATACQLQAALRLTNEGFARHLGVHVRTVAAWHAHPTRLPRAEMQDALDTTLASASDQARARFADLFSPVADTGSPAGSPAPPPPFVTPAEDERLRNDPHIVAALDWLDQHTEQRPGASRNLVAEHLGMLDLNSIRDRGRQRAQVHQLDLVRALSNYYGQPSSPYGLYGARCDDGVAATSVLTQPHWLDLRCPLATAVDRIDVSITLGQDTNQLSEYAADAAARRIAEVVTANARLVDKPLYRLADIAIGDGVLAGLFGVERFARYALTMDLLESEVTDAIAAGTSLQPGVLALRNELLPDLAAVVNVADRLCAGGALALLAVARPATASRSADFVLLVQERSGNVINAARRLAVIPKGFHQPITDYRADGQIGATLLREMEEELFGREDVDNTIGTQRGVDPMHPSRLSEPLRWLLESPALTLECTGFGLNLVSGNYEFASLIVIEDETFWSRYGGHLAANWETEGLRQISSLDSTFLREMITDVAWSNEGLFALLQGLRRLAEIGGDRVNLPSIEWELRS